jgi:hypothetical protein
MNYQVKEFELELNSKDFPMLNFQQFEQMADKATTDFVGKMVSLNAQFIALQDLTALGVGTKFFYVAGCAAIRRTHVYDLQQKHLFVRLEASALVEVAEVAEVEQLLPGEKPLNTTAALGAVGSVPKAN